jgi:hypothetical protein
VNISDPGGDVRDMEYKDPHDDHAPADNLQGEDANRRLPLDGDADNRIESRKFGMP